MIKKDNRLFYIYLNKTGELIYETDIFKKALDKLNELSNGYKNNLYNIAASDDRPYYIHYDKELDIYESLIDNVYTITYYDEIQDKYFTIKENLIKYETKRF